MKSSPFLKLFNLVYILLAFNYGANSYAQEINDPEFEKILEKEILFEQQNHLNGSDQSFLNDLLSTGLTGIDAGRLSHWFGEQQTFFHSMDRLAQDQQAFFIERSWKNMMSLLSHIPPGGSFKSRLKKVNQDIVELRKRYEAWQSLSPGYGISKDYRRIRAYVKYFSHYKKILDGLGFKERAKKPWQKKLKKTIVSKSFNHISILKEAFFPKKRKHEDQPLTKLMIKERRALMDVFEPLGLNVDVEGIENIPSQYYEKLPDSMTVNVFAYMHGNSMLDEYVKANVKLPHFMVVWAIGAGPMPGLLKKALEKSPSVVAVGGGNDTVALTLDRLKQKFTNNIAIHPQGQENIFNEVMPPHQNFSEKFLRSLRDAGYKVNLIPVSSVYAPNFINGKIDDVLAFEGGKTIKVIIDPPLNDDVLGWLFEQKQGGDKINTILRRIWLSHMVTDQRQLHGMLRPEYIYDRMEGILGPMILEPGVAGKEIQNFVLDQL